MLMDFDPAITGIASQSFWLHWQDADGWVRRHAPDFFTRRADGGGAAIQAVLDGTEKIARTALDSIGVDIASETASPEHSW